MQYCFLAKKKLNLVNVSPEDSNQLDYKNIVDIQMWFYRVAHESPLHYRSVQLSQ